jgi:hypothetical protein
LNRKLDPAEKSWEDRGFGSIGKAQEEKGLESLVDSFHVWLARRFCWRNSVPIA